MISIYNNDSMIVKEFINLNRFASTYLDGRTYEVLTPEDRIHSLSLDSPDIMQSNLFKVRYTLGKHLLSFALTQ